MNWKHSREISLLKFHVKSGKAAQISWIVCTAVALHFIHFITRFSLSQCKQPNWNRIVQLCIYWVSFVKHVVFNNINKYVKYLCFLLVAQNWRDSACAFSEINMCVRLSDQSFNLVKKNRNNWTFRSVALDSLL